MNIVLVLLAVAWFAVVITVRIAPFVGRHGGAHAATTPAIRRAAISRKVLARKLHAHE